MPRAKGIPGVPGIALIYLLLIARYFGHKFQGTNYLINAPVSRCSFDIYEEFFLYILKSEKPDSQMKLEINVLAQEDREDDGSSPPIK